MVASYFYPRGYGGNAVYELCRHLVKRGLKVHVITSSIKGEPDRQLLQGIYVHRIPTYFLRSFNTEYPISPTASSSILRVIRGYDIDLIHAHFLFSHLSLCTGFLKSTRSIAAPLVATSHGLTKGYPSSFIEIGSKLLDLFSTTLVMERARAIAAVSLHEYNHLKSRFSTKSYYIPNGTDTSTFKPASQKRKALRQKLGISENDVIALYFAQLRASKGILTLLKAIDIVVRKSNHVKFLIAGTGPLAHKVERILKHREDRVFAFLKYVPESTLPYLYNACDIYVLPSFVEGMPLSIMEAMACGKPIVATSVSDVPILVKQGVNGIIIPPGNTDALAESIVYLAENPELRKLMGEENTKRMAEYDWDRIAKQYHLLYLEAIHD
jgi:1,4-alpha-glucan branching enzyme